MSYNLTALPVPGVVIFEIGDDTFRGHARFARALDEMRVMGHLAHPVEQGLGRWAGKTSPCYVLSQRDMEHNAGTIMPYVAQQEALMYVSTQARATILRTGTREVLQAGDIVRLTTLQLNREPGYTLLRSGAFALI